MSSNTFTTKAAQVLAATMVATALAAPAALAGNGLVPERLGSPDPREEQANVLSAGMIPSTLGSQDPRDTAASALAQLVPHRIGSEAAGNAYDGDFMFRDYFLGTHYVAHGR
jgi:hypothetical protein